jgi:integrase/recombinase XerD
MGAFESGQSGVPPVRLVLVPSPDQGQPEGAIPSGRSASSAEPTATPNALVGNLREQRIEQFLDLKDIAPRTRQTYAQQLRWFSDWVDKDWQTVNLNDVRRYKLYLEQERQLKPNSVGLALGSLKSFYRWLMLAGYVSDNPMTAVSVPRPPESEGKNLGGFQVEALVKALSDRGETAQRDAAIFCLLFFAGLRANEVSGLNVGDYNGVEVLIRQAKHDSAGRVPVNRQTDEAIRDYLGERSRQKEGNLSESDPMFVSHSPKTRGQRLGYQGIYYMIKDLAKAAGLVGIYPHRGRHTFASKLIEDGMDAYLAMQLTRHRSVQAFKVYSNKVRYQAAKTAYWKGQGEPERSPLALEDLLAKGQNLPEKLGVELEPSADLTSVEQLDSIVQVAKVLLKLRVEHGNPAIARKLRRAIESTCLSRYQTQKVGREYLLTIPYEDEADLAWQIDWLQGEMVELAERDGGAIEAHLTDELTGQSW